MRHRGRRKRKNSLAQKKYDARVLKLFSILFIVVLVLVGLSYATRIDKFHIIEISVSGNSITAGDEIEEVVIKNLAGVYFKMFIKRNAFIYPKNRIKTDIEERFQRIEEVQLSVEGFKKINVVIVERAPDALWCGREYGDVEECYFLDGDGLIYSSAPDFSGNVFFKVYGSVGSSNPIGRFFIPVAGYQSLKFFKTSMEQFGLTPVSLVKLPQDDLEITLDDGSRIIYNSEQDVVNLSDDLISILSDPEFKRGIDKQGSVLDYIDLRFGNKVYFKFK